MALLIPSFEDDRGQEYINTYWRVAKVEINIIGMQATVIGYAYKSRETRDAGLDPIWQVSNGVEGDEFAQLYADHIAGKRNLFQQAYDLLRETRDHRTGELLFAEAKDV